MNMTTTVVKMDKVKLDQRWDAIERMQGRAPSDQLLGELVAEAKASGWTAKEIAAHRDLSVAYVNRLLIFGRFLGTAPTGANPGNLTERAFRDHWSETDESRDERKRFEEVARQLGIDLTPAPELSPTAARRNREQA